MKPVGSSTLGIPSLALGLSRRPILQALLGVACVTAMPTLAGEPVGVCVSIRCTDGRTVPCTGSCGPISRGNSDGGADDGSARREQEAAATAERQRQEEADRIERERLAKEKEEKDAEFIRDRDATASTLKGGIGTSIHPNDGGLKGSGTIDTGLRELRGSERTAHEQERGPQAAWRQLHCAAELSGYAFAALSGRTPDYQESSFLAGQASKALAGEPLSVECGKAPPMPAGKGTAAGWDRLRQTQQRMIDRTTALSATIQAGQQARARYESAPLERTLTPDEQRIQEVFRKQRENEARLEDGDAPAVAAQKAINRGQERKYDPKDAAAIREEEKAKAELKKYVDASKKLEEGKVGFDEATPKPRPQTAKTRQ